MPGPGLASASVLTAAVPAVVTTQAEAIAGQHTERLAWMDNLRIVLMVVVIAQHAAQPYGPTGGAWGFSNPTRAAILGPFFIVNAAFGMGLFFLMAGYFVPAAYDRKGPRRFLKDRLLRLALPLSFFSLVVFPPVAYAMGGQAQPLGAFLASYLRRPLVLHLWFLEYLVLFTCGYAALRVLADRPTARGVRSNALPDQSAIALLVAALAVVTFVVRVVFPVDRWIDPAPFLHVEPAHVPQYVTLFAIGVLAVRRDWLRRLPWGTVAPWFVMGLTAAVLPYAATVLSMERAANVQVSYSGGASVGAFTWSVLEALIAVGLSMGFLVLFREHLNHQSAAWREIAATVYAVYLIHLFPVVGLQLTLARSSLPPLAKFGVVTIVAVPLCFAIAYGLRRLAWVRRLV